MNEFPRTANAARAAAYPRDGILQVYSRILRVCRAAGLGDEAEDLAQDVWVWLLRNGCPPTALDAPWLGSVVRNFIRRYRRRLSRRGFREGIALDRVPEPQTPEPLRHIESNDLLDRVAAVLPETERQILALMRGGHTLAEAARLLRIPPGSRAYFGGRLIERARRQMERPSASGGDSSA